MTQVVVRCSDAVLTISAKLPDKPRGFQATGDAADAQADEITLELLSATDHPGDEQGARAAGRRESGRTCLHGRRSAP